MAKSSGHTTKNPSFALKRITGWGWRILGWNIRLSAGAFVAIVVVMGFVLHGSLVGRLIEGVFMVASMVVLWLIGTRTGGPTADQ